jgi:hypothetical protein
VKGGRVIPEDLFAKARLAPAGKPLTVFRAELIGREEAGWEDLFAAFTTLTTPFGESASTQVGMRRPSIEFAREKKGDRSWSRPSSWWRFEAEAEAPRVRRGWGGKSSAVGAF